nr:RNA-directed DNA polymerase, eukaryota [Tanacetum cinerariifolium]
NIIIISSNRSDSDNSSDSNSSSNSSSSSDLQSTDGPSSFDTSTSDENVNSFTGIVSSKLGDKVQPFRSKAKALRSKAKALGSKVKASGSNAKALGSKAKALGSKAKASRLHLLKMLAYPFACKHLQAAYLFAGCLLICRLLTHLQLAFATRLLSSIFAACICFAASICRLYLLCCKHLELAFASQLYGVGVPRDDVVRAASPIGCSIMDNQFRYLGVKIGGNMSRHKAWEEVVLKLRSRLSKWKVRTLSIGGRFTLLKSVLGASPLYTLSIFKAPKGVLKEMESIRIFFIGADNLDRKITWIAWDKVLASKKKG